MQIVRVNCGDHACVTLFSPDMWMCGTWFRAAVEQHAEGLRRAGVAAETAKGAITAVDRLLEELPTTEFTKNVQELQ